jgi:lipoprotein LprG
VNPTTLLTRTKAVLDSAPSLHFQLTSTDAQGTSPLITGGSGDARRPDGFSGRLSVKVSGFAVNIEVVSVAGGFYVKLPTDSAFVRTDPAAYGFGDPALLLGPRQGLSSLLLKCSSSALDADDRYNGEQLHEVRCTLPGRAVATLLTSADPSQDVAAQFGISRDDAQLRRVVLTGPFFNKDKLSTFTLVLDNYGENVSVTPPATE